MKTAMLWFVFGCSFAVCAADSQVTPKDGLELKVKETVYVFPFDTLLNPSEMADYQQRMAAIQKWYPTLLSVRLSLNAEKASVGDVLKQIQSQMKEPLPFKCDKNVQDRRVSFKVEEMKADVAIYWIAHLANCDVIYSPEEIRLETSVARQDEGGLTK